jgi:HK97 family phage prohead protease
MKMEIKTFSFKLTKDLDENGTFSGYASVFDVKDAYEEIIEAGAFKKTLKESKTFPLLWYHWPENVLGMVEGEEDGKGLFVKGDLNLEVQAAREKHALLRQKAIKGLSIGFTTLRDKIIDGIRYLKEIKLWEVSLVTFQANPEALVEAVKAALEKPNPSPEFITQVQEAAQILNALLKSDAPLESTQKGEKPREKGSNDSESREPLDEDRNELKRLLIELKNLKSLMEVKSYG